MLVEVKGPLAPADTAQLASIAARYSDAPKESQVRVEHEFAGALETLEAVAAEEASLETWRL